MPILQWLTREKDLRAAGRAPYRLLEEVERYGDGSPQNMLIQGDNLEEKCKRCRLLSICNKFIKK